MRRGWISFKGVLLPLCISALFLFLCIYRLPETYAFNGDMARDTLASFRILQSKDVTFIGPPLSLGQLGSHVTYFSSLIYYIGALGLALSGLWALGPVILIVLINASAVFPLWRLVKRRTEDPFLQALVLCAYATNPIILLYSRLFWNPSPLIGLGVWGLFFLSYSSVLFGITAALVVYFHYFGGVLFIFGLLYYLFRREFAYAVRATAAFSVFLSPFLLFEARNKFYLTSSFLFNLTHEGGVKISTWQEQAKFFLEVPMHLLGVLPDPFALRILHMDTMAMWMGLAIWIWILVRNKKNPYVFFFIAAAIVTAFASYEYIRIQYIFVAIGSLWMLNGPRSKSFQRSLLIAILLIQSVNTVYALSNPVHVSQGEPFLTLAQLDEVSQHIQKTRTAGKSINITENIRGDARAIYIRYFLEKDRIPGLNNELEYEHVDELYVLTPSLEKTMKEKRWEFTASGNTQLVDTHKVGEWHLLKFVKPLVSQ